MITLKGLVGKCGSGACTFTSSASQKIKKKTVKLAAGTLKLKARASGTIAFKLTSAGAKLLKQKGKLTLSVKVSGKDANGKTVAKAVKVKLKPR